MPEPTGWMRNDCAEQGRGGGVFAAGAAEETHWPRTIGDEEKTVQQTSGFCTPPVQPCTSVRPIVGSLVSVHETDPACTAFRITPRLPRSAAPPLVLRCSAVAIVESLARVTRTPDFKRAVQRMIGRTPRWVGRHRSLPVKKRGKRAGVFQSGPRTRKFGENSGIRPRALCRRLSNEATLVVLVCSTTGVPQSPA